MTLLEIVGYLIIGLVFLILGGEGLVRGSVAVAKKFGVSPLIIGLTIVSLGTSAPELLVSLKASLNGYGSISVGNVIGSNIVNIAFILGLSSLIYPITISLQVLKKELPILIGITIISSMFLLDGYLSRIEGAVFFLGIIIYTFLGYFLSKKHNNENIESTEIASIKPQNIFVSIGFIIGGLILLIYGGDFFVDGSVQIARMFNLSEAVIGLTIVAIGTSLPELFTSLIAAIKKESDIAIGNVIGSNIFNLLGILGISSLVKPIEAPQIEISGYIFMNLLTIFLLPLMWTGFKLKRMEGLFLVLSYVVFVAYLLNKN